MWWCWDNSLRTPLHGQAIIARIAAQPARPLQMLPSRSSSPDHDSHRRTWPAYGQPVLLPCSSLLLRMRYTWPSVQLRLVHGSSPSSPPAAAAAVCVAAHGTAGRRPAPPWPRRKQPTNQLNPARQRKDHALPGGPPHWMMTSRYEHRAAGTAPRTGAQKPVRARADRQHHDPRPHPHHQPARQRRYEQYKHATS